MPSAIQRSIVSRVYSCHFLPLGPSSQASAWTLRATRRDSGKPASRAAACADRYSGGGFGNRLALPVTIENTPLFYSLRSVRPRFPRPGRAAFASRSRIPAWRRIIGVGDPRVRLRRFLSKLRKADVEHLRTTRSCCTRPISGGCGLRHRCMGSASKMRMLNGSLSCAALLWELTGGRFGATAEIVTPRRS